MRVWLWIWGEWWIYYPHTLSSSPSILFLFSRRFYQDMNESDSSQPKKLARCVISSIHFSSDICSSSDRILLFDVEPWKIHHQQRIKLWNYNHLIMNFTVMLYIVTLTRLPRSKMHGRKWPFTERNGVKRDPDTGIVGEQDWISQGLE
jgi:hypothetical protein